MRTVPQYALLFALVFGAGAYALTHQNQVKGIAHMLESKVAPCSYPVTYSIGSIDPRFGISTSTFLSDLTEAEGIWETSGRDLFRYEEHGGVVTVNLVYDTRQATSDSLESTGAKINASTARYDTLKAEYESLSAKLSAERASYRNAVSSYEKDQSAYNSAVKKANARGGATASEYTELQAQKSELNAEYAQVKSLQGKVNADVDTLNSLAGELNTLIKELNLNVQEYNEVGASLGEFEEGLYSYEGGVETIDIYEFSNHVDLVRVLAHEMGHALGLEHVADPEAIMYYLNQGSSLSASAEDLSELQSVCSSGIFKYTGVSSSTAVY